jgi:prevent-host-death family protein
LRICSFPHDWSKQFPEFRKRVRKKGRQRTFGFNAIFGVRNVQTKLNAVPFMMQVFQNLERGREQIPEFWRLETLDQVPQRPLRRNAAYDYID